jgi:hypothetical protein
MIEEEAKLKKRVINTTLYHECDRVGPIYRNEALAAEVARAFDRSLWVFCPHLTQAEMWNAPWNTGIESRPLIYLRFGPGDQGDYLPVVIGFLPMCNEKPKAH